MNVILHIMIPLFYLNVTLKYSPVAHGMKYNNNKYLTRN